MYAVLIEGDVSRKHAQTMADRFGIGSSPTTSAWIGRCEVREVAAIA